ncbi:MAG: hypothetical protein L3J88_00965 [Gammaproteobacteria bacterium]|nr:hypothetical protein [Gammaproteobacteria bacterium]MCF6361939.1 hypothetical protein [Gammaproteobacteria bacterium]
MKRFLTLAFVVAGLTSTLLAAGPFAPKAAIPAGMEESHLGEGIRLAAIPDTDQVAIPVYPGAVVIRSYAVAERPAGYAGLPVVELISVADHDTVVAFYKKSLPDWGEAELMSAYYFAEHGNINFFTPEEAHVGIHRMASYFREAEREMLQRVLPGAKTLIKVFYPYK